MSLVWRDAHKITRSQAFLRENTEHFLFIYLVGDFTGATPVKSPT